MDLAVELKEIISDNIISALELYCSRVNSIRVKIVEPNFNKTTASFPYNIKAKLLLEIVNIRHPILIKQNLKLIYIVF